VKTVPTFGVAMVVFAALEAVLMPLFNVKVLVTCRVPPLGKICDVADKLFALEMLRVPPPTTIV
jgi:hypothetical protein